MASSRRAEPMSPDSLAQKPVHFFKVILPGILRDKKLRIPETFVRKFGDELSDIVTLTVPNGSTWLVQLRKDEKKIWFYDGWHDFLKYHSICAGHFLVFKYRKNSNFHVLIFDKTACEIDYPYLCGGPEDNEQNSLQQDEMESDDSVEITGFTTPSSPSNSLKNKGFGKCQRSYSKVYAPQSQLGREKPSVGCVTGTNRSRKCGASFRTPKFKHPNNLDTSTQDELEEEIKVYGSSSSIKRTVTAFERERALNAAKAFEPINPFCRVVLRPSYLIRRPSTMYFPSCFAKKHLKEVSGFIRLQTSDGKQRPVRCVHKGDSANLTQGWYEFVLENNLEEGDVCVFEVLRSSDIVLKVTVFHVLESAEFATRLSSNSSLRGNKFQKGAASYENPKFRHGVDIHSKRCKIEELDEISISYAIGDEGKFKKAACKIEVCSTDEENENHEGGCRVDGLDMVALLKDIGIFVGWKFRYFSAEERERAITAARLFKSKNPAFMIMLRPDNLSKKRAAVPAKFARKCLSSVPKYIKLRDADGSEFSALTVWYGKECYMTLLGGILKKNNLDIGDICLFEVIRMKELLKFSVVCASRE